MCPGEEMDFLELLKSFGLDMASVATALGIDIATLNNMDKDVLLHLLTSQGQPAPVNWDTESPISLSLDLLRVTTNCGPFFSPSTLVLLHPWPGVSRGSLQQSAAAAEPYNLLKRAASCLAVSRSWSRSRHPASGAAISTNTLNKLVTAAASQSQAMLFQVFKSKSISQITERNCELVQSSNSLMFTCV